MRRSIPQRNAASVFPEPVGAQIRVLAPLEIAGQPPACAGVGASNDFSNQPRTGAENGAKGSFALAFRSEANPWILGTGHPGLCLPAMPSDHVELLREVYERWGRGDFKTEALYSDDFTMTMGPDFPDTGVHAGLEGVAAYTRGFLEPWERITITAEEMEGSGDRVLVRVLQAGAGAASGIETELRYFHLWSFSAGQPVAMETIMHEDEARAKLEAG